MANEIQKRSNSIADLLKQKNVIQRFNNILGSEKRANAFTAAVLSAVKNNVRLAQCEPQSIMFAAATAASLDLVINENLGYAYLVPYGKNCQFQLGWKGFVQLAQRSGLYKSINATEIYEGQLVKNDPLNGFEFDFDAKESETVIGYAAKFELLNGFSKTLFMTTDQVRQHGKRYSKSFASGPWKNNFDAMALKTVIKLLLAKYGPMSIEMQRAEITDQSVVKSWDGEDVEYIDNPNEVTVEAVEDHQDREQSERVENRIANSESIDELEEMRKYFNNKNESDFVELVEKRMTELIKGK